jgi:hypothetical protein
LNSKNLSILFVCSKIVGGGAIVMWEVGHAFTIPLALKIFH